LTSGASRLLTSGQKDKVPEGSRLIRNLVKQAGSRIIIMPGSGLNESNIAEMAKITGATEFHITGSKVIKSDMSFRRKHISMGGVPGIQEF
jgi:copper homeostasis protein